MNQQNSSSSGDQLLKPPEVQARLRIGPTKFQELVNTRTLRAVRIGRAVRVAESELARFITDGGTAVPREVA